MISEDTPDHELLYYMSERESSRELAEDAFDVFSRRHYAELFVNCRKCFASLLKGRPSLGISVNDAAQDLSNAVMLEVADNLCGRFQTRPDAGNEHKVVQVWLARIAENLARREIHRVVLHASRHVEGLIDSHPDSPEDIDGEGDQSKPIDAALTIVSEEPEAEENEARAVANALRMQAFEVAWRSLSDRDRRILELCVQFDSGWVLGGHATKANAKALADALHMTPPAIRQARKRALDRLRKAMERKPSGETS